MDSGFGARLAGLVDRMVYGLSVFGIVMITQVVMCVMSGKGTKGNLNLGKATRWRQDYGRLNIEFCSGSYGLSGFEGTWEQKPSYACT